MARLDEANARLPHIERDIYRRHRSALVAHPELDPADAIEAHYGPMEMVPGWYNAQELQDANDELGNNYWSLSSKWTQSPERYRYMQDVGRDVDLLRGLIEGTPAANVRALDFWDRSLDARPTDNWDGANYQRFGGIGNQFINTVTDPAAGFGAYLTYADIVPNVLKHLLGGSSLSQAVHRAHALKEFQSRYRLGKNPVLDLPSPNREERSIDEEADDYGQWLDRHEELSQQRGDLQPPSGQRIATNLFGGNASPFVGDAVETAVSMMDPSLAASFFTALPARMTASAFQRVARAAGRPRWHPPLSPPTSITKGDRLRGVMAQARAEAVPEAVMSGAARAVQDAPRTWIDYFFTPQEPAENDPSESNAASRRDAAARAMLSPSQMRTPPAAPMPKAGPKSYSPLPATPWR